MPKPKVTAAAGDFFIMGVITGLLFAFSAVRYNQAKERASAGNGVSGNVS
jgi:hypothetical protein